MTHSSTAPRNSATRSTTRWLEAMALLSIASLMTLCACTRPALRVIPADRYVTRLDAGKPYTPSAPGWFVPDARMLELLERGLIATNR